MNNPGHFEGAVNLINKGILKAQELRFDYLIVTASDTWLTNKNYIDNIIIEMRNNSQYLACSSWGTPENESIFRVGFSMDFFIIDINWQKSTGLFPLDYKSYLDRFIDYNFAMGGTYLIPERAFSYYWLKYWSSIYKDNLLSYQAKKHIRRICEREPIHFDSNWIRKMEWKDLGIYTIHDQKDQKTLVEKLYKDGLISLKSKNLFI
jgi:hypothetical protein